MKKLQPNENLALNCRKMLGLNSKWKEMMLGPDLAQIVNNEVYQSLVDLIISQPHIDVEKLLNEALSEKLHKMGQEKNQSAASSEEESWASRFRL